MRLLITGSRDWADAEWIRRELEDALGAFRHLGDGRLPTLLHGANGVNEDGTYRSDPVVEADAIADRWWRWWGLPVEMHHALWHVQGRAAGPIRNHKLVADCGATACLAFIRGGSRGASHCAGLAERYGIPTRRLTLPALAVAP